MSDNNSTLHARAIKLPRQRKGGPVIFTNTEFANFVSALIESLANMKIIQPTTDGQNILSQLEAQMEHGEFGAIVTMPPAFNTVATITGGGSTTIPAGNGPPNAGTLPAGNYTAGQFPSFYADTQHQFFYECIQAGDQNSSVWQVISNAIQMFITQSVQGDYITAQQTVDGITTFGPNILIAKPYNLRRSLTSESFDGTKVFYNWNVDDGTGNYRVASSPQNQNAETQVLVPRYRPSSLDSTKDIIFAKRTLFSGVPQAPTWIEDKPARMFCLQNNSAGI